MADRLFAPRRAILGDIAWAHSGDKGDMANIGVVVRDPLDYAALLAAVTPQRVAAHFRDICHGTVAVYQLPRLNAVNVVMRKVLDGGGARSLRMDTQGKALGEALLALYLAD